MDFLANFGKTLPNELKSLGLDSKEILLVLQQSQKWIMTKNCNIVKRIMSDNETYYHVRSTKFRFFICMHIYFIYLLG